MSGTDSGLCPVAGFDSAVKPLVSATRISGGSLRYGYVVQEIISDFA